MFRSLLEAAGAALIVAGLAVWLGVAAALICSGVCVLLKVYEMGAAR